MQVQRHLQLRIAAQAKYLRKIVEEQQQQGSSTRPALRLAVAQGEEPSTEANTRDDVAANVVEEEEEEEEEAEVEEAEVEEQQLPDLRLSLAAEEVQEELEEQEQGSAAVVPGASCSRDASSIVEQAVAAGDAASSRSPPSIKELHFEITRSAALAGFPNDQTSSAATPPPPPPLQTHDDDQQWRPRQSAQGDIQLQYKNTGASASSTVFTSCSSSWTYSEPASSTHDESTDHAAPSLKRMRRFEDLYLQPPNMQQISFQGQTIKKEPSTQQQQQQQQQQQHQQQQQQQEGSSTLVWPAAGLDQQGDAAVRISLNSLQSAAAGTDDHQAKTSHDLQADSEADHAVRQMFSRWEENSAAAAHKSSTSVTAAAIGNARRDSAGAH